ncbi:MAG: hypothetical protein M1837_000839 [Sclerophora amabilis]|nr:MAG: hypothetical protein M1837_000839 [Sclerophora amabilis]
MPKPTQPKPGNPFISGKVRSSQQLSSSALNSHQGVSTQQRPPIKTARAKNTRPQFNTHNPGLVDKPTPVSGHHRYNLRPRKEVSVANLQQTPEPRTGDLGLELLTPTDTAQQKSPSPPAHSSAQSYPSTHLLSWIDEIEPEAPAEPSFSEISRLNRSPHPPWFRKAAIGSLDADNMTRTAGQSAYDSTQIQSNRRACARSLHYQAGLRDRNVVFYDEVDDKKEFTNDLILAGHPAELSDQENATWTADLSRCKRFGKNLFKALVMFQLIDRAKLGEMLNFSFEFEWDCERVPQKPREGLEMSPPKPDVTFAFKSRFLIPAYQESHLKDLEKLMFPEAWRVGDIKNAFPFLALEVQGGNDTNRSNIAIFHNLNTASQALHNMHKFFETANMQQQFFDHVRFFSATATHDEFEIRVHRAAIMDKSHMEANTDDPHMEPEYPLAFLFEEVYSKGGNYSKAEVSMILDNILSKYGVSVLLPLLKEAVQTVLKSGRKPVTTPLPLKKRPAKPSAKAPAGRGKRTRFQESESDASMTE